MIQLYVEKNTDQMRSTLMSVGLARLLHELEPASAAVRLADMGSCYAISAAYDREQAHAFLKRRGMLPQILPALIKEFSPGEQKTLAADPQSSVMYRYKPRGFPEAFVADYKAEREKQQASKGKKAERQEGGEDARHRDFPLWAHFCSYFGKGSVMRGTYPEALHAWWAHQGQAAHQLLDLILDLYAELPNDPEAAARVWIKDIQPSLPPTDIEIGAWISASIAVSPSTCKGHNRPAVAMGLNADTLQAFWLEMYLALAGYMVVGMPYRSGPHALLYYPLPADMAYERLQQTMDQYRQKPEMRQLYDQYSLERVKLDALAYLTYYENLIERLREALLDDPFDSGSAEQLMGLAGYFYKENGGAQIPFDEVVFSTPSWLPLASADDCARALDILHDHRDMIQAIRGPRYELNSDELLLIEKYRRFITTGGTQTWIDFAISYHFYRFAKIENAYLPNFHRSLFEDTLKEIMMSERRDYRPILESPGFQAITNAIRACTVTERYYQDVKKQTRSFKVRHGLGDDLLRYAHDAERFLMELSSFIHDYSRESSNVQADSGETRPFVTAENIADVVQLVNDYGPRIVAHLLVAVGYASDYRKSDNA
ncbi:MAG: hypothetical protein NZ750_14360 [Anaerolineae bacterium]|nr:hypothetical protein [Anaerolineae bacterium]MDW8170925.1 hypothetical protein [Anaerolineae bacterium]